MTDPRPSSPAAGLPWEIELAPVEVRERLAWARRRGHPRYLWPDVRPEDLRRAVRELEVVVRGVLTGGASRLEAGDRARGRALGVAGYTSGVGPLMGRWIEDRAVLADELAARVFAHHLHHGRRRADRLAGILERACGALAAVDVTPTVVKSAHTARVYYPEPGVRPSLDVDLVVEPGAFERAERGLARAGFRRAGSQRRPRKSDWAVPGLEPYPRSLELHHAGGQYGVDLHASLARNFHGVRTVEPGPPADRRTGPADFVSARARVLRQPSLVALHALHASEGLEHLTLGRVVEIVLMIRRDGDRDELSWRALEACLRESDGLGFTYPAFTMAERLAPGTVDPDFLAAAADDAPPPMRRILDGMRPGDAQRFDILSLRERFMWCRTAGDVVRRLAHMLLPAPTRSSFPRLAGTYLERAFRVLRGRVGLSRDGD